MERLPSFYKLLPKVELHAHLNGSLSTDCLKKLNRSVKEISEYQFFTQELCKERSLKKCFPLFKIAHDATSDPNLLYEATKYVIDEFHNDNVVHLELRTTPRAENQMTEAQYVESVVKGIRDSPQTMITKLLLSIDRRHDLKSSQETMSTIIQMYRKHPDIIKGVDLSGDPTMGFFNRDLFEQARGAGLLVALHCGEVENNSEVIEMLNFGPNRLGHGTCIHPKYGGSEECWELYQKLLIPVECCLTSNILCETAIYEEHHAREWIENKYPFSLCTDDKGVFGTSMSREMELAAQHLNLTNADLWNINYNSIDYSFAADSEKQILKGLLEEWKLKNQF